MGTPDGTLDISFSDWVGVQQLIGRYVDAVDRHDPDALASCWAKSVVVDDSGQTVDRKVVVDSAIEIWKGRLPSERFRHFVTNVLLLSASPDTVKARVAIAWATATADGVRIDSHHAYTDEIVKEDGEWRFRRRQIGPYELIVGAPETDK